jgi:hypothetical protein
VELGIRANRYPPAEEEADMRTLMIAVIASSVLAFGASGASVVTDNYSSGQLLAASNSGQQTEGRAAYEGRGPTPSRPGNDFGPDFDNMSRTTAQTSG